MIAQDRITSIRNLLSETNAGQRWSDQTLIGFIDRAQKRIVRELKWPPSRFVFTTTPTVQEYQLQEVIKVLAVYLNGQILDRTDIPTMEGRQIMFNDQTGQGGGPGGLVVPNQAPVLAGNQYTPQWTSQPAASYPVSSDLAYSTTASLPWFTGRRPVYYCEGGNIGFVPAPLGAMTLVARVVAQPTTLQYNTDALVLPDIAADAIDWQAVEYAYFSDKDTSGASDLRNYAMSQRQDAMREVKAWCRGYDGDQNKGIKMLTNRSFYVRGNNRMGGW